MREKPEFVILHLLFMHDPILQFRQFGIIPTVGGANQIAGYALQTVNVVAMAVRAL